MPTRRQQLRARRNRQIAERRANGESYGMIGKDYGISRQAVHQICKAAGVDAPKRPKRPVKLHLAVSEGERDELQRAAAIWLKRRVGRRGTDGVHTYLRRVAVEHARSLIRRAGALYATRKRR